MVENMEAIKETFEAEEKNVGCENLVTDSEKMEKGNATEEIKSEKTNSIETDGWEIWWRISRPLPV